MTKPKKKPAPETEDERGPGPADATVLAHHMEPTDEDGEK